MVNWHISETRKKPIAIGLGIAAALVIGAVALSWRDSPSTTAASSAEGEAEGAEAEVQGPPGFVPMTPVRLAASGVQTTRIEIGSLGAEVIAQATVAAPPEGQALVAARADGAVTRISKRLGDPVGVGETVALLESRDAAAIVAERSAASARAQAARAAAARERRLFNQQITARQDLEAADAARAEAEAELRRTQAAVAAAGVTGDGRHLAVRSPIAGRITAVGTQLGAYVTAGAELFRVADPRRVQIEAAVPAIDAQRIRPGDTAVIELPDGGTVDAVVRSTTPSLNAESRTATVVLTPFGAPPALTQGQAVRARIVPRGSVTGSAIVVPEDAVQQVEGRESVFVQTKGGFQAVPVTVGQRAAGRAEIVEGLKPGQVVVTKGAFVLKAQLEASELEE